MARRDAARGDAPAPPRGLAPVLRFNRLPDRALAEVRRALDSDDGFRARVLESLTDSTLDSMDRGARLFLERPEGWEESLGLIEAEMSHEADRSDIVQREAESRRRAEQLEEAMARVRGELQATREELARVRSAGDASRRERDKVEGDLKDMSAALEQRAGERDEAVRQLGEARALADRRLAEIRGLADRVEELESAAASDGDAGAASARHTGVSGSGRSDGAPGPVPPKTAVAVPADSPESSGLTRSPQLPVDADLALMDAASAAEALAGSLRRLGSQLERGADPPARAPGRADSGRGAAASGDAGGASGRSDRAGQEPNPSAGGGTRRRTPARLGRGLLADSVEGLDEFLGRPETFVLVDGYNVSMAGWPGMAISEQRDMLLRSLGSLSAISAADIHVVFDGAYEGARPAVSSPLPVRVHFTEAGVEADDRILEFVDDAPLDDAVVVISSDSRVRDGARERGAVPVPSSTLLERIRR
jgi:predicted RNA-binding protein with PIN domain